MYIVDFDYSMVKVKMYTRVPLGDILGIQKGRYTRQSYETYAEKTYLLGAYILSALQEASRTVADNYGFVINFRPRHNASRVTSYALRNQADSYPSLFDRVKGLEKPSNSGYAISRVQIETAF